MTTKLPASVEPGRFPDAIHYPDSDDEPLPDGRYQVPYFVEIVGTVREHFRDRPDVEVSGNTFIYYEEGNPGRFISPDLHVTLGVTAEGFASMDYRNTYLVWEIGKPADFVLEIASESTARRDVTEKRVLYAQIGFGEYWRFDGSGGDFYGEPLVGEYRKAASTVDLTLFQTPKAGPTATARRSPCGCIGATANCDFTTRPPANG